MGKKVLVKFLEKNAIFEIPECTEQLQYLQKEFRREYNIEEDANLDICFQRYDQEWDEYVDLRGQSCIFRDKEKLRAVVTQALSTSKVHVPVSNFSGLHCESAGFCPVSNGGYCQSSWLKFLRPNVVSFYMGVSK